MGERTETGVVIVGTGFSGLGMAIQLRKQGRDDFVILEKADEVGGTWRDNAYPGCACDIQSHMYSFSFEQNPNWTRSFSPQPEIWDYLRRVAKKYDLYRHVRFGQEMTGARWDSDEHRWHVATRGGDGFAGKYLVNGVGALHIPQIPQLAGIHRFQGETFHSAQWNHDFDVRGKRVAVIGTGASAIQFVPQLAPDARELTLFQRTPPWVMPKPDHAMPAWVRALFRAVPGAQRAYRTLLYWLLEARAIGFNGHPGVMKIGQRFAKANIDRSIADPRLRAKLTPDYTMGCKRVLISNDYYPALARDDVGVNTTGVKEVRAHSVVDGDGVEHEVDAIIYGTGFHVTDAFDTIDMRGPAGRSLRQDWAAGMAAYYGMTVAGFPNMFILVGPNTGLGHNSIVFMIEAQTEYLAKLLALADARNAKTVTPTPEAQNRFTAAIQRALTTQVWSAGGCQSWYLDEHGRNTTLWPASTWDFRRRTRKFDVAAYDV
ncbi:MAG TPA: NAD(P)/FAD-dependent oxidoreductase, partial [Amycolatopsis sp.]|nr:NAD(P)/FAD-dependent oxidoreductase [Amycolatopsis sp.]